MVGHKITLGIPLAHNSKISYFPCPKNACSSVKRFIFSLANQIDFDELKLIKPDLFRKVLNYSIHSGEVFPTLSFQEGVKYAKPGSFRFAVVRDPVERLLSCYSNRVLHYQELSEPKLEWLGKNLSDTYSIEFKSIARLANPSFGEFVDQLDLYRLLSPSIRHHTNPQTYHLGASPGYFDRIYDLEQLTSLQEDLNSIYNASQRLGRWQQGGAEQKPRDINKATINRIAEFYFGDYCFLEVARQI